MNSESISERIMAAETEFFNKNAHEAKYLIMSPYSFIELVDELRDSDDHSVEFPEDVTSYEGLIIATTHHYSIDEFRVV